MITIRKYQEKDRENLLKICIETSSLPTESKKDLDFLNLMFNDYYAIVEPDNCFVAADENDEAVGYILCAENFDRYFKTIKGPYLPMIKKLGMKYYTMAISEIAVHSIFRKKYPAHLHIDILDDYQGKGYGSQLMDALLEKLKSMNIPGIMLIVDKDNAGAQRFYQRKGFVKIASALGGVVMARNL